MMTHGDRKGKSERETARDEEINRDGDRYKKIKEGERERECDRNI